MYTDILMNYIKLSNFCDLKKIHVSLFYVFFKIPVVDLDYEIYLLCHIHIFECINFFSFHSR